MTRRSHDRARALRRALRTLTPAGWLALLALSAAAWWLTPFAR